LAGDYFANSRRQPQKQLVFGRAILMPDRLAQRRQAAKAQRRKGDDEDKKGMLRMQNIETSDH
jgi:hypothetical protein